MGFSLIQRPQAYLKKSVPGETEASMLRTSGSCSGESVGPPASAGAAPATSASDTSAARWRRVNREDPIIRVPFVDGWGNAAHIRAGGGGRPAATPGAASGLPALRGGTRLPRDHRWRHPSHAHPRDERLRLGHTALRAEEAKQDDVRGLARAVDIDRGSQRLLRSGPGRAGDRLPCRL